MATTVYFEETIVDQDKKEEMDLEIGRSSFYSGVDTKTGEGEDSIYVRVDGKLVIMDMKTAERFVEAAFSVGCYFGLLK